MRITVLHKAVLAKIAAQIQGLTLDEISREFQAVKRDRIYGAVLQLQRACLIGLMPGFRLEITGLGQRLIDHSNVAP